MLIHERPMTAAQWCRAFVNFFLWINKKVDSFRLYTNVYIVYGQANRIFIILILHFILK